MILYFVAEKMSNLCTKRGDICETLGWRFLKLLDEELNILENENIWANDSERSSTKVTIFRILMHITRSDIFNWANVRSEGRSASFYISISKQHMNHMIWYIDYFIIYQKNTLKYFKILYLSGIFLEILIWKITRFKIWNRQLRSEMNLNHSNEHKIPPRLRQEWKSDIISI